VKELETKIRVFISANGTFRIWVSLAHKSGAPALSEKYIANNPAKNMTSLPSQTIVPTLVVFGR
jgi:exosome complex RNA-binding protein Rrp4